MAGGAWRLLRDDAASARWNMSVDEALLLHVRERGPALRLYAWRRPSVSLGYRQRTPDWMARCGEYGLDIVRRCTGGGSVIHLGDLTYSVVVPSACPGVPDGLDGSHRWVRDALIRGLREVGVLACPSPRVAGADRSVVCFAASTGTEISVGDAKLVGSAQRRKPWGWLQHGSIRLHDDSALYRTLFAEEPEPLPLRRPPERETIERGLERGFAAVLGQALMPATLSDGERQESQVRHARRGCDPLAVPRLSLLRRSRRLADRLP